MLQDIFRELPFVGARKKQIDAILELAQIKKGDTVVDLGSGDGRLLIEAAKKGAIAVGYEINPILVFVSKVKTNFSGVSKKITIKKQSLWDADLKKADVIFVYAMRKSMPKFENFIFGNSKRGVKVIANTNPFPNKTATKSINSIFLYKI